VSEERGVRVELTTDTGDRATADTVKGQISAIFDRLRADVPGACKKPVGALLDRLRYQVGDTGLKVTASWTGEQIGEAMMCAMAGALRVEAN